MSYILAGIIIQVLFWRSNPNGFVLERQYGNLHITYHGPAQDMPLHVVVLYTLISMFSFSLMTFVGCGRLWATIVEGKRTLLLRRLILFHKTALWRIIERRRGSVATVVLGSTVLLGIVRVYAL